VSQDAIRKSLINTNYAAESSILELVSKLLRKLGLAHTEQDVGQEELDGVYVMSVLGLRKSNTDITTKYYSCTRFIFIVQSSYMFRPHVLAICAELQIWLTRTAYMASRHRWLSANHLWQINVYVVHFDPTCNSLKMSKKQGRNM